MVCMWVVWVGRRGLACAWLPKREVSIVRLYPSQPSVAGGDACLGGEDELLGWGNTLNALSNCLPHQSSSCSIGSWPCPWPLLSLSLVSWPYADSRTAAHPHRHRCTHTTTITHAPTTKPPTPGQVFLTPRFLGIAMEYAAGGDLYRYLIQQG